MYINYESTTQDIVEAQFRAFKGNKLYKKSKIQNAISCPLLGIVIIFFATYFNHKTKPIFYICLALMLLISLYSFLTYDKYLKKRLKKIHIDQYGDKTLPAQYKVDDKNLTFCKDGCSISFELRKISKIIKNDNDIEVQFINGDLCIIPNKAFTNEDQKLIFIASLKVIAS